MGDRLALNPTSGYDAARQPIRHGARFRVATTLVPDGGKHAAINMMETSRLWRNSIERSSESGRRSTHATLRCSTCTQRRFQPNPTTFVTRIIQARSAGRVPLCTAA